MNSEIARTNIDMKIVSHLWGLAAGRCEMCNLLLYIDPTLGIEGNYAQNAHIHAVGKGGPRHKKDMTQAEINQCENLMLLCPQHHKTIDTDPIYFTPDYLFDMKQEHENRIRATTDIPTSQETRMVSYIAPIDESSCSEHNPMLFRQAVLSSGMYPKQTGVIKLNKSVMPYEATMSYYNQKSIELEKTIKEFREIITAGESISIFPLGLQPHLIKLGTLINNQTNIKVFQCHRDRHKWAWGNGDTSEVDFITRCSKNSTAESLAFVIDLSAVVTDDRIASTLGESIPIWHLTLKNPNRYFVTNIVIQDLFVKTFRSLFENIKIAIPNCKIVHLFPIMPASLNVRLGMDYMPKSDFPIKIYDQSKQSNGFFETITIGG